jgi:hypothetical protein
MARKSAYTGLITGREYKTGTPKGFQQDWEPNERNAEMVPVVLEILDTYRDNLPLTVRQVFYIAIGQHGFEKSKYTLDTISNVSNMGRRSGIIPWDAIRDDGFSVAGGRDTEDTVSVRSYLRNLTMILEAIQQKDGSDYRRPEWQGQAHDTIVCCEAAGMVPQLRRATQDLGAFVTAGGGFDSTSAKYDLAARFGGSGRDVTFLLIGDYDESGLNRLDVLAEDITQFMEGLGHSEPEFIHLAVTEELAEELRLTPDPFKEVKAAPGGELQYRYQAEAIPPDDLARITREAVEENIDWELRDEVAETANQERYALRKMLGSSLQALMQPARDEISALAERHEDWQNYLDDDYEPLGDDGEEDNG